MKDDVKTKDGIQVIARAAAVRRGQQQRQHGQVVIGLGGEMHRRGQPGIGKCSAQCAGTARPASPHSEG